MRWRRRLGLLLVVAGLANSGYWGWCQYRISKEVLFHDESWPRAWPYPDGWLDRWHSREYARVRAQGLIPFHGEWDTLRAWMLLGHLASAMVGGVGVVLLRVKPRPTPNQALQQTAGHKLFI